MKNLTTSYYVKPWGYQTDPQYYLLEMENEGSAQALSHGVYHQMEDWVALELTAEQMLSNELSTLSLYVAGDAAQMWAAIKDSLLPYELAAGDFLLRAADPTQIEWLQGHWWSGQDNWPH